MNNYKITSNRIITSSNTKMYRLSIEELVGFQANFNNSCDIKILMNMESTMKEYKPLSFT